MIGDIRGVSDSLLTVDTVLQMAVVALIDVLAFNSVSETGAVRTISNGL